MVDSDRFQLFNTRDRRLSECARKSIDSSSLCITHKRSQLYRDFFCLFILRLTKMHLSMIMNLQ